MPARDRSHNAVRNALFKDGWTITHDPLNLSFGGDRLAIDLGAERVLAAERGQEKIAVEIKMFATPSPIADLEDAIGQYVVYRVALRRIEPERLLYLAVPQVTLENKFQQRELWKALLVDEKVKILGYDEEKEELTTWLP